jgi:hypothetical protein
VESHKARYRERRALHKANLPIRKGRATFGGRRPGERASARSRSTVPESPRPVATSRGTRLIGRLADARMTAQERDQLLGADEPVLDGPVEGLRDHDVDALGLRAGT